MMSHWSTHAESKHMATSESRPFTAATSKLAFAQAFAGTDVRRPSAARARQLRLTRGPALLRRLRRA